jgi:UDP-N-acetylmuramoyl-L-alanyl-D-glutamate--2,6-diaminopimelate ligase
MTLAELIQDPNWSEFRISGISEDSRIVQPGDAFIAVSQHPDQRLQHVQDAVKAGAAVILVPEAIDLQAPIPLVPVANLAAHRSEIAARYYQSPSQDLCCVGITGTNGKTSIAWHLADLSHRLGVSTGYCGTLGWGELAQLQPTQLTTPSAVILQSYLATMRAQGAARVAMEVSSHALDQGRVSAVQFDVAVFSNLSRDHLDYHQTTTAYKKAKAKLFQDWPLAAAVINSNDAVGRELLCTSRANEVISYGTHGDLSWHSETVRQGMRVSFATPWGRAETRMPVAAEFAVANVAAAMAVLLTLGHSLRSVAEAAEAMVPVPGRMQVIDGGPKWPRVVVDYAHTPDALEKALAALRPQCRGNLICVVGCGGDRDRGKRAQMGHAAVKGSDCVWFTSDNPRSEDPEQILHDMGRGLEASIAQGVRSETDRAEAIAAALTSAEPDDVVLIAGKGHEQTQEINGELIPFSDFTIVHDIQSENT